MTWLGLLRAFLELLAKWGGYASNQQQIDAGKAIQANEATKEVERRVEQADRAVSVDDPARTKRLRSRFDRALHQPYPDSGE
jgi:predicted RecB family endonuclease